MPKAKKTQNNEVEPFMIYEAKAASSTTARRNIASSIERTDRFKNIDEGLIPFSNSSSIYGGGNGSVDVRDAVILCQKAYYNFPIFRNIIDLMTEFSVSDIYFRGGNSKSQEFFTSWANKINLLDLQDKFFREYYRSGNVFIYRHDAKIMPEDVVRITQVYGEAGKVIKNKELAEPLMIPTRYAILNPADIQMVGSSNFSAIGLYRKILTDYEIFQLKNPKTDEDVEVLQSLPPEIQNKIKSGQKALAIPLDANKISIVFYKKQDYEPFAVPMGYGVLEDINAKYEMKKIDMAVARTMQQWLLLVKVGAEINNEVVINSKNIETLRSLFNNQSVGRVLVTDFMTDVSWQIPDVADFFDPKKYEIIERDINLGLNNIFTNGEKFANQQQKVEVFIARLEQGRKAFLNDFLVKEIKRIAEAVGFRNYPTPYFEDIALKDNIEYAKIYTRLVEVGALTPEQGIKAIQSNVLPDPTIAEEEQTKYKKQRDKGLYTPLVGGGKGEEGRPEGGKSPSKKVTPIGGGAKAEVKYSAASLRNGLVKMQELEEKVIAELKTVHEIKRLNKIHKSIASDITKLIVVNELPDKWESVVASYVSEPIDKNPERVKEVNEISAQHQVEDYVAAILLNSKIKDASPNE